VIEIARAVAPGEWSVACPGARTTIELPAAPEPRALAVGDRLELVA
jgi:hypothetical protein